MNLPISDYLTKSYFDLLIFAPKGYTACECRASNETCITPYGEHINKLCSGQGECVCGECKCAETQDGQYSGRYCEECPVSSREPVQLISNMHLIPDI